jgi:hypothetical protein
MTEQTNCPLPRGAQTAELHPWETHALDIATCDRTEIVVTLYEHEKAGTRPESWPDAVRVLAFRQAERWIDEHAARAVRAVSYGAPRLKKDDKQVCVLILHHSPKKD